MRVLWVKMGGLWPLTTGARQRSFNMLSELARRNSVSVVTTSGPDDNPAELARALSHCDSVMSVAYAAPKYGSAGFIRALGRSYFSRHPLDLSKWTVPEVRKAITDLLAVRTFDVVVADFLAAVPNIPSTGRIPVVLFEHNVEHLIWKRLSAVEPRWWRRALLEIEWRKMRSVERRACTEANLTVAVSEDDRNRLAADAPGAAIVSVPTGVDVDYFQPGQGRQVPGRLVFSGSMDWYPNEDAMLHFVHEIMPRVRAHVPAVSLTIVGRNPTEKVRTLGDQPGVLVTGTVNDVRPYIAEAALYIVPLRVGGGTRLKIFEALAMGKAVVSTTVGAEGLDLVPGMHIALADGSDAFSQAVVRLLEDAHGRESLGQRGRRIVEERYSWPSVTRAFELHLQTVMRPPRQRQ